MALAGRKRVRIVLAPTSGPDSSPPAAAPAAAETGLFSASRKLRAMKKQGVFVIDLGKGTAVPVDGAAGSTGAPTSAHTAGPELLYQPVSRLETRKAMAKAGLLTTSDVVDMSALASKLEKRAAALNAEPARRTWQFGK